MKRVFIIHGWGGAPYGGWQPWLKTALEKLGYHVFSPDMPGTDAPTIEKWVNHLSEIVGTPDSETFFIGHSIGCQTILRYLETIDTPVGGALFVAGWFNLENMEDEKEEEIAKPWIETPLNTEKIQKILLKSTLVISDNDPYGAFEENKQKFAALGSNIFVLHSAGHITATDGFSEAPVLVEQFQELI
jgi:predicted alpha/beta hydrolase family esterase